MIYDTNGGTESYKVTTGVPQGSVLRPLLWSNMYDAVLNLSLPSEATIVGFAVIDIQLNAKEAIAIVQKWLDEHGLKLAAQKTEAFLISSKRKVETTEFMVAGYEVVSQQAITYLGVYLDSRLKFGFHAEMAVKKATKSYDALPKVIPDIEGPNPSKRRLLANVVSSTTLYAAPVEIPIGS